MLMPEDQIQFQGSIRQLLDIRRKEITKHIETETHLNINIDSFSLAQLDLAHELLRERQRAIKIFSDEQKCEIENCVIGALTNPTIENLQHFVQELKNTTDLKVFGGFGGLFQAVKKSLAQNLDGDLHEINAEFQKTLVKKEANLQHQHLKPVTNAPEKLLSNKVTLPNLAPIEVQVIQNVKDMHQGCYSPKSIGKKRYHTLDSLPQEVKTQAKLALQKAFQPSKSMELPKHSDVVLPDLGLEYHESTPITQLVRQNYRPL